jgi:CheY-like chemotaxis protein
MAAKLLLVDDEKFFLEGLKEGLSELEDIFTTDICFSVDEAIKLIKKNQYDLIVSDIRMPKKSGLVLFDYLKKNKYHGGFIAMTAYGTPEVLKKIKKLGGLDVILKPFNFAWFRDKILDYLSGDKGVSGTIDSIDLTSLLQMVNLEKKTIAVKVKSRTEEGVLHFDKGEIIHAEYGDLEGEEAAFKVINISKGIFSLVKEKKKIKQTIDTPFMVLLMNIMKTADEDKNRKTKKSDIQDIHKEEKMNVKKLNQAIEVLKDDLGEGLLSTDIYGADDGQSLAGWNSNPQACALFNQITGHMTDALDGAGFPTLGRYYILDLVDDKMVVVITMGEYEWGLLVDRPKAQLGLLLNVVIPKIIDAFEEAIAS